MMEIRPGVLGLGMLNGNICVCVRVCARSQIGYDQHLGLLRLIIPFCCFECMSSHSKISLVTEEF